MPVRAVPSRSLSGPDDRLREPERRRREDHHGGQSRDLSRPRGDRVLVIDLDPQGNATSGLGRDRAQLDVDLRRPHRRRRLEELHRRRPGRRVSTSSRRRSRWPAPRSSSRRRGAGTAARRARSDRAPTATTIILIDCPPSLGLLTVNALTAADAVLIPIQCEYYALEGLTQLLATINLVRDHLNPTLDDRRRRADDVRRPHEPLGRGRRRGPPAPRRRRSSRRSSRAASASPRRRATACRSRSTAPTPRAPPPTATRARVPTRRIAPPDVRRRAGAIPVGDATGAR